MFDSLAVALRLTDRKRLLQLLNLLGAPDAGQRAKAALDATRLLQDRGLSWRALLPIGPDTAPGNVPPPDWRERTATLMRHAAVTAEERAFLLKMSVWRSPGIEGAARLNAIAARVEATAGGLAVPV